MHLLHQVFVHILAVLCQLNDSLRKALNVEHVHIANFCSHARSRSIENVLGSHLIVGQNLGHLFQVALAESLLCFDEASKLGVRHVVRYQTNQLWEMPPVPFPDAHSKRVDVLVQRVEERNCLDDHVVASVHVKLDLATAVAVAKTKLCLAQIA